MGLTFFCLVKQQYTIILHNFAPNPQIEKLGPSAKDVIKKAIAKGVLDGSGISSQTHPTKLKKRPSKSKRVFSHCEGIPMTIAAQKKVVKKKEQTSSKKIFR